MNILMIGAHADDCDILASGLALKYVRDGHCVRFLAMTDGSAGHHILNRADTAARRLAETQEVSKLTGIAYDVWDVPDGQLMPDLATRERLIRYIRNFAPDGDYTVIAYVQTGGILWKLTTKRRLPGCGSGCRGR